MPTYQYACTDADCGLRFERVQAFTDDAVTSCPECSERVRKVYGSVGVVFKGSGFYRNDSRDAKSGGAPAKADKSEPGTPSSGDKSSTADKSGSDSANAASKSNSNTSTDSGKSNTNNSKASVPVAS